MLPSSRVLKAKWLSSVCTFLPTFCLIFSALIKGRSEFIGTEKRYFVVVSLKEEEKLYDVITSIRLLLEVTLEVQYMN